MVVEELQVGVLDSGMNSLHCASNKALARGQLKKASRLACWSILLRSFFSKKGLDANGHRIASDETDFAILLNFFAERMLKIRAFLHKPKGDQFLQNLYLKNVLPHVIIYRALVRQAFALIKCQTEFPGFAAELLAEPTTVTVTDYEHYYAMCEFHADPCYEAVVRSCDHMTRTTDALTNLELATCILNVGKLLVSGTEQTIENNGVAPIYAQQVLWRLLVTHDAHFASLFLSHKDKMLLLPHAA